MKPKNMSPPPVLLHSRELVCENTVFSVFLDHVSSPGGHDVARYLSVLPKQEDDEGVTGVGVLPVKDRRLGLIHVFRHPLARWSWEIPKGFVDPGETPTQAALRELKEEMGSAVQAALLKPLGTVTPEPGVIKSRIRLYSVDVGGADAPPAAVAADLGHGEIRFFDRQEIIDLISAGEMEDACTLSVLWLHFLEQERRPPNPIDQSAPNIIG